MNDPKLIVIHCSASKAGKDLDVDSIREMHVNKGWSDIGYHFVITLDGRIQAGRPMHIMGAHVRGHNRDSLGICYVGGLDKYGKAKDTRTEAQKIAMHELVDALKVIYPDIEKVVGHRDLSPDLNGDGTIQANERVKECPCFHAIPEFNCID